MAVLYNRSTGEDVRSVTLLARNIRPGVTFCIVGETSQDTDIWVATTKITVDNDWERIHVVCRSLGTIENRASTDTLVKPPTSFSFDFERSVEMVGFVVLPNDSDDQNMGNPDLVKPEPPITPSPFKFGR